MPKISSAYQSCIDTMIKWLNEHNFKSFGMAIGYDNVHVKFLYIHFQIVINDNGRCLKKEKYSQCTAVLIFKIDSVFLAYKATEKLQKLCHAPATCYSIRLQNV